MSAQRRNMMAAAGGGTPDPYAGWEFGYTLRFNHPETLQVDANYAVSPYIEIPQGCQRLTFKMSNGGHGNIRSYLCKSDGTYRDGGSGATIWNATVGANDFYARMVVWAADIADCYLLDVTHNVYIWKGQNVT